MITFLVGLAVGIALGRIYGLMKYRYPESQEMIKLKVAKIRAERVKYEAEEEFQRSRIDESLHERTYR